MIAIVKLNSFVKEAIATLSEAEFLQDIEAQVSREHGKLLLAAMRHKRVAECGYYTYLLMPDVNQNQLPRKHNAKTVNATA